MAKIHTFERFESKYMISGTQYKLLLKTGRLRPDTYPRSSIFSVYYDTEDFRVIRQSMDMKRFKEKLRLRAYDAQASAMYLEIKRKVNGVVYKRRKQVHTLEDVSRIKYVDPQSLDQVEREIRYVFDQESLVPRILIYYEREAYKDSEDGDFRLTVDRRIRSRFDHVLDFNNSEGAPLIEADQAVLEVKTRMGYPRWFLDYIEDSGIRKQSFSKYGTAYKRFIQVGSDGL